MEEEKLERSIRKSEIPGLTREEEEAQLAKVIGIAEQNLEPVSYTHLTLPTILRV